MIHTEVVGADRVAATLDVAAAELANPTAAARGTGRVVATTGRFGAPKRTGRLAANVSSAVEGGGTAVVSSTLRYSQFVHYGTRRMRARPFLTNAARQTQPVWVGLYAADADRALSHVKGV